MGLNAPLNRTVNYKLDNEVAADLQCVYIDNTEYLQLTSKSGNVLSQFPFTPVAGNTTITDDIIPELDLGGIVAGVTLPAGTDITTIFKKMLHKSDYFVSFVTKTKADLAELSDTDLVTALKAGMLSYSSLTDSQKYSSEISESLGIFFVLIKDNVTFTANYSGADETLQSS